MSWLLDTVVVSELRSRRADPGLLAWVEQRDVLSFYLAATTVFELERGVQLKERSDPAQGAVLREWLDTMVLPAFAGRILPIDAEVARRAAGLHVPDPRPERDALIAAAALVHRLTVVTRNVRDFEPMGVPVVNPWKGSARAGE